MAFGKNLIVVMIVAVCLSSLRSDGKTLTDQKSPDHQADESKTLEDIFDGEEQKLPDLVPSLPGDDAVGLKGCFRMRVLKMLLRVLLVKASGFNINQLRTESEDTSTSFPTTTTRNLGISDSDLEQICKDLCEQGLCPPGCPNDTNPPWGKRR